MYDWIARVLEHKGQQVETTTTTATVVRAVEQMNVRRIGSLVVVEGDRLAGIFTERDVLVRVVARGLDPSETLVGDVMTRDPIIARPDMTISEAMKVITESRCRHLPVVDGGRLVGLISSGDLTSWVVRNQERAIYDLQDYIRAV